MENICSTIATASSNSPKLVGVGIMGGILLITGCLGAAIVIGSLQGREVSCGPLHVLQKNDKAISTNEKQLKNN